METPQQPPNADAEANTDQATRMGSQPSPAGSLILEDMGTPGFESEIAHKKKGKVGLLFYVSVFWVVLIVFCAIFADLLPVADPLKQDIANRRSSPFTNGFILGADGLGRDILARLVHGARTSVVISVTAVVVGSTVGGVLGLSAGYIRGRYEGLVMGGVNTLLAFPGLILLLTLVAFVGQNLPAITVAVAFLSIPTYTRVSRATTLAVSQREFVLAAKAMGAKRNRILFREIAPNVAMPVMAFGLIALGTVIILEGSLAFLGLSVQPPTPTWGTMINEGRRTISDGIYHLTVTPALVLFFTVFSLNYVGDSLRNVFDVREGQL
ncbi:MAG: ABC transporter permease [Acidimicrobiia bacterium]|nr:ABC transporter permease [Acidimicrobiia bacterium]